MPCLNMRYLPNDDRDRQANHVNHAPIELPASVAEKEDAGSSHDLWGLK